MTQDEAVSSASALSPVDDQISALVSTLAREPAAAETPILDGAEIATARRYAKASRRKSMQVWADYVRDAELFRDHAGERFL